LQAREQKGLYGFFSKGAILPHEGQGIILVFFGSMALTLSDEKAPVSSIHCGHHSLNGSGPRMVPLWGDMTF